MVQVLPTVPMGEPTVFFLKSLTVHAHGRSIKVNRDNHTHTKTDDHSRDRKLGITMGLPLVYVVTKKTAFIVIFMTSFAMTL